jgi:hypothetical protein
MEELLVLEMLEAIPRMKETLAVQVDVMAVEVVAMAQQAVERIVHLVKVDVAQVLQLIFPK